ncbi:MAG TPA: hypothetical protein VK452_06965 [Dissulfurispiraceae bacterium]|nr:hypothetical protein [Dissulfurispiraceae bacterium]
MKYSYRIQGIETAERCAKVMEILHTEGIESAQAWLDDVRKNDLYDHIEQQYLKSKKIILIN